MNADNRYLWNACKLLIVCILGASLICTIIFIRQDMMQKYNVYQSDQYIIVENRKNPKKIYIKEYISYSDFINDAYLCTKEGEKAKCEKEAFLYVDLGDMGKWWADPFNNLETDKVISNEYVPDGLINELKKYIHLDLGIPLAQFIDEAGCEVLTEDEVKKNAPEVYAEVYNAEAVMQWYYKVDFDNDNIMDIVAYDKQGMGSCGFTEIYFYQQMQDGQYNKAFRIEDWGHTTKFLRYEGKNYFMDLCILDYNASEYEYDYHYCDLYCFQYGYPQEVVRLAPENNQLSITVRKRFVNDFINIPAGH